MSDKPLGPGWWLASAGTWHPPELHPSNREVATAPPPTTATVLAEAVASPIDTVAPAPAAPPVGVAPLAGIPPLVDADLAPPVEPAAPTAAAPEDAPMVTVEMPPLGPVAPRPVPSLSDVPKRPTWSGESDHRAEAGPMFPDLFQQAVAGSALANAVTVNYADGEHRDSLDVANYPSPGADDQVLVSAGGRMPVEVGAFTGASAKKRRWRL